MALFNLIIAYNLSKIFMKKYDSKDSNYLNTDPVESYFECISSCDISDGICISKCVEILKDNEL